MQLSLLKHKVNRSAILRCPIGTPGGPYRAVQRHNYSLSSGQHLWSEVGMLRRLWKPVVGAAVLVGVPSYLYFKYTSKVQPRMTFDLPVRMRGPDGKPTVVKRPIGLLTKEEAEERLKAYATSASTVRPNGIVWKQTTAFMPSNNPIEDANASQIIQRDVLDKSSPGDLLFFAVMDGHAGPYTSRLLSKVLIPSVALELALFLQQPSGTEPKASTLQKLKSLIWPVESSSSHAPSPLEESRKYTPLALERAFTNLDSEIVDSPLRILAQEMSRDGADKKTIPNLSQHPMAMASMLPAMSGSCAILALFDTAHRDLYIASTGDCRAVAGVWEENENGTGTWRTDVLTEDQTGRNPNELKRMQSEHPADEADTVIMRGRVLGGLEPTRAFGDARYKWSRDAQAVLNKAFLEGNGESMRATPALLKTPPYVTARPAITHRKLNLPSADSEPNAKSKSGLRFVVLATDGLWDELSSEEVVALVGGHLAGLKGAVPKSELSKLVPTASGATVEGKEKRLKDGSGSWVFFDDNVSTHLIRNALGRGDPERLRQLLSIPAPLSRNYRDDITCTVVYWEAGGEDAKSSTFSISKPEAQAKAKL
ncbi:hypothetical protein NM688_g8211 [Phlebia brevispora]|uniref:Uncharacterized protein n=1 Tax=Phlebia brevispora TaxID=194682 RepID=A0ACC1RVV9_9APHY|nr:hypothetical protein NM688_g8211 [Phlebia brevispora]